MRRSRPMFSSRSKTINLVTPPWAASCQNNQKSSFKQKLSLLIDLKSFEISLIFCPCLKWGWNRMHILLEKHFWPIESYFKCMSTQIAFSHSSVQRSSGLINPRLFIRCGPLNNLNLNLQCIDIWFVFS